MSYAREIIDDYFRRTMQPGDSNLDGAWQYQMTVLREILGRLETILADEGVPDETARRVIRCMLYGAPSVADAELRMQQQERLTDLMMRVPSSRSAAGLLDMPPR